ncbi:vitamin B6 photo-protection and homoeostasis-domain-containing protein [Ephemerocybe angulata]|uniref:Vitamin B6 photo-protection and homoeostasis-domain-containing protein n=1 Tax=Ephemerocybe angulata TaxID=980116 RepID=A0A8H6M3X5_9AGAR|nr:vitamin B6 photo-protection and homoeostasis-domain-containing protein [Tulosesus angulatus]
MRLRRVTNEISERRPSSGQELRTSVRTNDKLAVPTPNNGAKGRESNAETGAKGYLDQASAIEFLQRVFLPQGYPDSVTPDYTRYQIYNALQAFCNSLAGLIASRALLEGQGIGNPSASATNALLLNIVLDVFSRTTTIISAHLLGSSLVPDAKRYRLLADILNDSAVALDTLSPVFNTLGLPQLRISALCLSASFRALCGIVAGGSKAAISLHFSSPTKGKGDIGDLNAKDASKETVLALLGMLVGSLVVPRLTSAFSTYTALFFLIGMHILLNYLGVQGIVLRTLNHERLWISWFLFDANQDFTPERVNSLERIFPVSRTTLYLPFPTPLINPFKMETFSTYRNPLTGDVLGYVTLGSSLSKILERPLHPEIIAQFQHRDYILWFDPSCLAYPPTGKDQEEEPSSPTLKRGQIPHVHVCFKERCSPGMRVQAWIAAGLLCKSVSEMCASSPTATLEVYSLFLDSSLSPSSSKSSKPKISEHVVSLLQREEGRDGGADSSWSSWKKKAVRLGWALEDDESVRGDPGMECGVGVPEPETVIVSLGYSYEAKKDV